MSFLIPIVNTLLIAIGVVLLLVGLTFSPWPVQLGLLIAGLLAARIAIAKNNPNNPSVVLESSSPSLPGIGTVAPIPEHQSLTNVAVDSPQAVPASHESPPIPTLSYRGSHYEFHGYELPGHDASANPTTSAEPQETVEVVRQYRGATWKTQIPLIKSPQRQFPPTSLEDTVDSTKADLAASSIHADDLTESEKTAKRFPPQSLSG